MMPPGRACRRPGVRRGFTLAEAVASICIGTVLIAGLASALVIAGNSLSDGQGPVPKLVHAADAAERLACELACAQTFTVRSGNQVEFAVADRDSNSSPELIRYSWSGTAGDPLLRVYNGGSAAPVAEDVQEFGLTYNTRAVTRTETTVTDVETEVLLASFTGWSGIAITSTDFPVTTVNWASEYFRITASLPADAFDRKITRVALRLKRASTASPTLTVGIHRPSVAGGNIPGPNPVGSAATILPTGLATSYTWTEAVFGDVALTSVDTEFCIVVKNTGTASASVQQYSSTSAPNDVPVLRWTSNSGGSWSPTRNYHQQDVPFNVYGSYKRRDTQETSVTRTFVTSVDLILRLGTDSATRIRTSVPVLNGPEVPTP